MHSSGGVWGASLYILGTDSPVPDGVLDTFLRSPPRHVNLIPLSLIMVIQTDTGVSIISGIVFVMLPSLTRVLPR